MAMQITLKDFEHEVLKSEVPVLLDFYADWCGPCQALSPIIEQIAEEVTDAKICKVNVDEEPELAMQFEVMSIPTLVVIKDGEIKNRQLGVRPKPEIIRMLAV